MPLSTSSQTSPKDADPRAISPGAAPTEWLVAFGATEQLEGGAYDGVFDASTFKEVLDQALHLARRVDRLTAAMEFIAAKEQALRDLQERLGMERTATTAGRPTVLCIESVEPLTIAGYWIPEVVERAGGRAVCTAPGQPPSDCEWATVLDEDPSVIALVSSRTSIDDVRTELEVLRRREEWHELSAVQDGRVFVFDGSLYFNTPGPRLYRSIELMAAALHGPSAGVSPQSWEVRRVPGRHR